MSVRRVAANCIYRALALEILCSAAVRVRQRPVIHSRTARNGKGQEWGVQE
ncbi:MAG: hypothetical protein RQ754_14770 [Desulfuromonadales bacterium]|nr:hypothetical protein [Desulfuromonadales bacterium]